MASGSIIETTSSEMFNAYSDLFGKDRATNRHDVTSYITLSSGFTIESGAFISQMSPNLYFLYLPVTGTFQKSKSTTIGTTNFNGHPLVGHPAMILRKRNSADTGWTGYYPGVVRFNASGNIIVYNISTATDGKYFVAFGPVIVDQAVNLT